MSLMFSQGDGLISISELLKESNRISLLDGAVVKTNQGIEYYDIPSAFDIEVSSFYEGEEISENKRAIMYTWQFGILNSVTLGRTWESFLSFLSILKKAMSLSEKRRLVVYVHNLPYEFQFIRKRLKWNKVFILTERKPVYALTVDGIEFRCSLKLAGGKSLENVGKDLTKYKVKKMVGYLDYSKIRTPRTPLSQMELKYCENDIRVLLSYIQEKIEQDGDITKIPLTNTGYVRNYCRKMCYKKWRGYRQIINDLTIDADEYSQLKRAFQGGFTHANAHYVDKLIQDVSSHDFGSSYPSVMVLEKFPMSRATLIKGELSIEEFKRYLITKCCLFDVEFFDLEPIRFNEHPLSKYKCWICDNAVIDNGRVVTADHVGTTITEQEFFTYTEFYTYSTMSVKNLRVYEKNYLPKSFVLSILSLYEKKTILKGIEEEEINYMISKNMINASYGMIVTDPVRDELIYKDDNTFDKEKANLVEAIDKYNKNIRRFLFYPWGVWITAYARANLFSGIIELGDDYIYSDTDSLKCVNVEKHRDYFDRYNQQILEKIKRAAEYHNIDISKFSPSTQKGIKKVIGVWEDEGIYDKFKTLGAKRYLTLKNKKYVITLAGANKRKTMDFLIESGNPFGHFKNGLKIPPENSGRLTLKYIDEETEGDIIDMCGKPYHYHELSSIHMEPSEYNLSMAEDFIRYLEGVVDFGD